MGKVSKPKKQPKSVKTRKGHQSSTNIVNAALELIRERGYEETTMRAIADKAGVSLGNAYHYYPSKAHLVQAFYHRLHDEQVAASRPILEAESSLKARLLEVMRMKIERLAPYHEFAGALFKTAASLTLRERCERCGMSYAFADAGDGPAIFVILIAGFIVVGAALVVEVIYQPPFWLHALLWGPLILVVTLLPLRLLKGLLIVLQYHHSAAEGRYERERKP